MPRPDSVKMRVLLLAAGFGLAPIASGQQSALKLTCTPNAGKTPVGGFYSVTCTASGGLPFPPAVAPYQFSMDPPNAPNGSVLLFNLSGSTPQTPFMSTSGFFAAEFAIVPVPEPATLLLVGGAALTGIVARRRRSAK